MIPDSPRRDLLIVICAAVALLWVWAMASAVPS